MPELPPQLEALAEGAFKAFVRGGGGSKAPRTLYDDVMGFVHAVAWLDEPWLLGLLGAEALLLLAVVCSSPSGRLQPAIGVLVLLTLYFIETINAVCHARWRSFATQDYFDPHGVFLGAVVAFPLFCTLGVQIVLVLREASYLLISVKRKELGVDARDERRAAEAKRLRESEETSGGGGGGGGEAALRSGQPRVRNRKR